MMIRVKACKRCGKAPTLQQMSFNNSPLPNFSMICCTIIVAKSEEAVYNRWNEFNKESEWLEIK